jgi:hypothetical protein
MGRGVPEGGCAAYWQTVMSEHTHRFPDPGAHARKHEQSSFMQMSGQRPPASDFRGSSAPTAPPTTTPRTNIHFTNPLRMDDLTVERQGVR